VVAPSGEYHGMFSINLLLRVDVDRSPLSDAKCAVNKMDIRRLGSEYSKLVKCNGVLANSTESFGPDLRRAS